jgi:parallel beta-helix repeat protein
MAAGRATVELAQNRCENNRYNGIVLGDDASGIARGNHCARNQTNGILAKDRARLVAEQNVCQTKELSGNNCLKWS